MEDGLLARGAASILHLRSSIFFPTRPKLAGGVFPPFRAASYWTSFARARQSLLR
jgi:hypothetical protein